MFKQQTARDTFYQTRNVTIRNSSGARRGEWTEQVRGSLAALVPIRAAILAIGSQVERKFNLTACAHVCGNVLGSEISGISSVDLTTAFILELSYTSLRLQSWWENFPAYWLALLVPAVCVQTLGPFKSRFWVVLAVGLVSRCSLARRLCPCAWTTFSQLAATRYPSASLCKLLQRYLSHKGPVSTSLPPSLAKAPDLLPAIGAHPGCRLCLECGPRHASLPKRLVLGLISLLIQC